MQNIGEELVGAYLQTKCGCNFISYNVNNPLIQGEIDVVGINLLENKVYFCEVAIHLTTGLQYVKDKQPNWRKIHEKFARNHKYATNFFKDYNHVFMFWSPIVKTRGKSRQLENLLEVQKSLSNEKIDIELVINKDFWIKLTELSDFAAKKTEELKSPVLRLLQIIEYSRKHVNHSSVAK